VWTSCGNLWTTFSTRPHFSTEKKRIITPFFSLKKFLWKMWKAFSWNKNWCFLIFVLDLKIVYISNSQYNHFSGTIQKLKFYKFSTMKIVSTLSTCCYKWRHDAKKKCGNLWTTFSTLSTKIFFRPNLSSRNKKWQHFITILENTERKMVSSSLPHCSERLDKIKISCDRSHDNVLRYVERETACAERKKTSFIKTLPKP